MEGTKKGKWGWEFVLIAILAMVNALLCFQGLLKLKLQGGANTAAMVAGVILFTTIFFWQYLRQTAYRSRGRTLLLTLLWSAVVACTSLTLGLLALLEEVKLSSAFAAEENLLLFSLATAINFLPLLIIFQELRQSHWLAEELKDVREEFHELEERRESLSASAARQAELETLREEVDSLVAQLAEARAELERRNLRLTQVSEETTVLKQALHASQESLQAAERTSAQNGTQAALWERRVANLREALEASRQKLEDVLRERISWQDKVLGLEHQADSLLTERDHARELFDGKAEAARLAEAAREQAEAEAAAERLRATEAQVAEQAATAHCKELETQSRNLTAEVKRLKGHISSFCEEISRGEEEVKRLQAERSNLLSQMARLQQQWRRAQDDLSFLRIQAAARGTPGSRHGRTVKTAEPGQTGDVDPAYGLPATPSNEPGDESA